MAEQLGINRDTLRGWVKQAQIDAGARPGVSCDDRRRLVELERGKPGAAPGECDLEAGIGFLRGGARPPIATLVGFIDEHGHDMIDGRAFGVEPICTVLSKHGCPIAPSTYYATKTRPICDRVIRDAELITNGMGRLVQQPAPLRSHWSGAACPWFAPEGSANEPPRQDVATRRLN